MELNHSFIFSPWRETIWVLPCLGLSDIPLLQSWAVSTSMQLRFHLNRGNLFFFSCVWTMQSCSDKLMHVEDNNKIFNPSQMKERRRNNGEEKMKTSKKLWVPLHSLLVSFSSEATCLTDGFKVKLCLTLLNSLRFLSCTFLLLFGKLQWQLGGSHYRFLTSLLWHRLSSRYSSLNLKAE